MKKIVTLCALTLLVSIVFIWRAAAKPVRFGTFVGAPKAEVATLIAKPDAYIGKTVAIEGTVTSQCKAAGCFFSFRSGGDMLRVDLEEIATRVPTKEGRTARVEGQIVPYYGGHQFHASAVEFE